MAIEFTSTPGAGVINQTGHSWPSADALGQSSKERDAPSFTETGR